MERETATLAGGCFWCLEAVYDLVEGVESVVSGYTGGRIDNPSYELVCSGSTGHAEAVQITYNSQKVSFRELLGIFFSIHDPTTLNRQGADVGSQYRSAIFFHNSDQESIAQKLITEINDAEIWEAPVVTEVVSFEVFYPAENYHQNYFANNPNQAYCRAVVSPKVAKFRSKFSHLLK